MEGNKKKINRKKERAQEKAKETETHSFIPPRTPKKHHTRSNIIYTEHLVQTHTGLTHAPSLLWVHKSFNHVDLEDLVFIVSSIPSGSYIFFCLGSLIPKLRNLMEISH